MMPTTLAPRDGRVMTETPTSRHYAEHRVETRDGAIEIVWTEGHEPVLLAHDGYGRVALDLLPEEAAAFAKHLMRAAKRSGYREPVKTAPTLAERTLRGVVGSGE